TPERERRGGNELRPSRRARQDERTLSGGDTTGGVAGIETRVRERGERRDERALARGTLVGGNCALEQIDGVLVREPGHRASRRLGGTLRRQCRGPLGVRREQMSSRVGQRVVPSQAQRVAPCRMSRPNRLGRQCRARRLTKEVVDETELAARRP